MNLLLIVLGVFIDKRPYWELDTMARRIVFAEEYGFHNGSEFGGALFIDQFIAIDWKHKIALDSWSDDVAIAPPSFIVGLTLGFPTISREYGIIKNAEDVAWLKGATHGSYLAESVLVEEVKYVIGRIHQLGLRRDDIKGFEIEVFTGEDAKALIDKTNRRQALAKLKEVWPAIPLGIGFIWWWFF